MFETTKPQQIPIKTTHSNIPPTTSANSQRIFIKKGRSNLSHKPLQNIQPQNVNIYTKTTNHQWNPIKIKGKYNLPPKLINLNQKVNIIYPSRKSQIPKQTSNKSTDK